MKHTKRLLALLLTLVMLLSAMPMTALTSYAAASDTRITDLKDAIDNYTEKMDGTVYVNMKAAYDAYINALKVYDSAVYGANGATVNDVKVAAATNALNDAVSAMTTWTRSYASATYQFAGDTGSLGTNVAGVLYASTPSNFPHATRITANNEPMEMVGTAPLIAVVLYDGTTTVKIPVLFSARNSGANLGNDRAMLGWYPTSAYNVATDNPSFQLAGAWANRYETGNKDEPDDKILRWTSGGSNGHSKTMAGYNNSTSEAAKGSDSIHQGSNASNFYSFANTLNYVGGDSGFTDGLKTVNMYWRGRHDTKEGGLWWIGASWGHYYYQAVEPSGHIYYVIDYKSALDQIDAKKSLLDFGGKGNLKYRYNELSTLLTNFDKCTVSVTNSGYTDSNAGTNATAIAKTLSEGASGLSGISSVAEIYPNYQTLRNTIDTAAVDATVKDSVRNEYAFNNESTHAKWTTSSFSAFKTAYENAQSSFNMLTATGYNNYTASGNTTAATRSTALINAYNALAERADFTDVENDKRETKFNVNAENYTYDSFYAFAQARKTAFDYADLSSTDKADTAKDTEQSKINAAHTAIHAKFEDLQPVDAASKYETFDAVVATVQAELAQTGKYSAAAIEEIQSILDEKATAVYHTVTADEAALLGVTAGTKLKNTTTNGTDTITADLLTAVNTITQDSTKYNTYNVSFTAEKDGEEVINQTATVPYGTVYTFDLGSNFDENANTVVWSATTNDGSEVTGSNKMNGRGTIDKLIDTNIAVHAVITGYAASNLYTYKIYNGNGRLVAIEHHATNDVKEFNDAKALVAIPFYTFDSWYIEVDENTKTVTVKAAYAAGDPIHYTVFNGTLTDDKGNNKGTAADLIYDRETKVAYTGNNTFYAWAVKVGSKYTVVSYNNEYTFYSHTALDFVPIIKDGNTYKFETESGSFAVTAEQIASASENTFGLTADEYVTAKLDNKAPFIAVVGTKILNNEKTRAFAMVTEGCTTAYTGVGMKFDKGGNDPIDVAAKPIPTVVSTGQFSVTLSGTTRGSFRATVNYDFPYSQAGGTAHLDVTDVSDLA